MLGKSEQLLGERRRQILKLTCATLLMLALLAIPVSFFGYCNQLYKEGRDKLTQNDWNGAIQKFHTLGVLIFAYKDGNSLLKIAEAGLQQQHDEIVFRNFIREGDNAAQNGKWSIAEEKYRSADKIKPSDPEVMEKIHRVQESERQARDAINFRNLIQEGDDAAENGKWSIAEEKYRSAEKIRPSDSEVDQKIQRVQESRRQERDIIVCRNLTKEGDDAAANGEWSVAEQKFTEAHALNSNDMQIVDKLARAKTLSELNIPDDANIHFFSACNKPDTILQLAKFWIKLFPRNTVGTEYPKWSGEWQMLLTRIYYMQPGVQQVAENIANWLPGKQEVLDYNLQLQKPPAYPDAPPGVHRMKVDPHTLIIFIGADYKAIASMLDATANGRHLSEQEINESNVSIEKQERDWQAVNQIVQVNVFVKSGAGKGLGDQITCTVLLNETPISNTYYYGKNEFWNPGDRKRLVIDVKEPALLLFKDRKQVKIRIGIVASLSFENNRTITTSWQMISARKTIVFETKESAPVYLSAESPAVFP